MAFLSDIFNFGDSQNAHQQVYGGGGGFDGNYGGYPDGGQQFQPHKSSWTHELIAGAAGFEAMKAYENHVRSSGQQVSHPLMKEMLAGFAAAEVDKLVETKGLDFIDRERAKHRAIQQAHGLVNEQYGPGGTFNGQWNQYGDNSMNNPQQQGGYGSGQFGGGNYPQQGSYGSDPYGGGNYSQQESYGSDPYGGANYPQQGSYGSDPYGGANYPQQGSYGSDPYGGGNYQQY